MIKREISIITLTKDRWDLLEECGNALKRQLGQVPAEWIIMDNGTDGSGQKAVDAFDSELLSVGRVLHNNEGSFSWMNNFLADMASAEKLLFLNNDVKLMSPISWVLTFLNSSEVGVIGGVLVYPNKTLQHAGIIMQENAAPANLGMRALRELELEPEFVEPFKWAHDAMPFRAVTGALMGVRTSDFRAVGGFDETFPWGFEDVDLCLRIRSQLKLGTFCTRHIGGVHIESASGSQKDVNIGLDAFRGRWGHRVFSDYQRFQRKKDENLEFRDRALVRILHPDNA